MPDPTLIVTAVLVAAASSILVLWISGSPWREPRPAWTRAGWVLGVAIGFALGCLILGNRPHWPIRQDQDRLLGLVFPAIVILELTASLPGVPRELIWPLRLAVVLGLVPILLHGSIYLTDIAGPGTRQWSPAVAAQIVGGLSMVVAAAWVFLDQLTRRAGSLSCLICLATTTAGAAVTIMLSGYASGGQIGLPLASALAAAGLAAAFVLPPSSRNDAPLGVAIVGLFSLLVIGHFFGQLTTAHAALLLFAPLLGSLPEIPYLRGLPTWARVFMSVILVGTLVSAVVFHAQRKFVEDFWSPSGALISKEPSIQDYAEFGR